MNLEWIARIGRLYFRDAAVETSARGTRYTRVRFLVPSLDWTDPGSRTRVGRLQITVVGPREGRWSASASLSGARLSLSGRGEAPDPAGAVILACVDLTAQLRARAVEWETGAARIRGVLA